MKLKQLTAILALSAVPTFGQQLLSDFSDVLGGSAYFYDSWESTGDLFGSADPATGLTQNVGSFTVTGTGVTDSSDSAMEIYFDAPLDLSGYDAVAFTAQALVDNAATAFTVSLFDGSGLNKAFATFSTASFLTGSSLTVESAWTTDTAFDIADVQYLQITGGNALDAVQFSFQFDSLSAVVFGASAVPEPSTYAALFGVAVLGFASLRRRRRN